MLRTCSPFLFYFALGAIALLPLGLAYWGYSRARREEGVEDFDRSAWLLVSLSIAALASIGVFVVYIFSHAVGC
jgi:hypothetical protein